MKRACLLLVIVLWVGFAGPVVEGQGDCGGFTSRLVAGRLGVVSPGEANNVRESPSTNAAVVGQLQPGEQFTIIDGPVCAGGYTWWEVATPELTGFTVEGSGEDVWLEPVPVQDLEALAAVFSFDFTPVTQDITLNVEPEENNSHDFNSPRPPSLSIEFVDPIIYEYLEPRIDIWPIEAFREVGNENYDLLLAYSIALHDNPTSIDSLPFLPRMTVNAARIFQSHEKLIEFNGGRGYRYIAQYAQYPAPIRGSELFYAFQGTTADHAYYVSVILPLDCLPLYLFSENYEGEKTDNVGVLPEYDAALTEFVMALDDDDFLPTLATLDAVVGSIRLDGLAPLPDAIDRDEIENINLYYDHLTEMLLVDDLGSGGSSLAYYTLGDDAYIVLGNTRQAIGDKWTFAALLDVLKNRPADPEAYASPLRYGLYRPLGNIEFINTDQLLGVRFIVQTESPDEHTPITNPLEYVFRGVSKDGWYQITGYFPVTIPLLTDAEAALDPAILEAATATDDATYQQYAGPITNAINGAAADSFYPCLDDLDTVFETMTFDGTIIEPEFFCEMYPEPVYQFLG